MSKILVESDDDIVISGISGRFPNARNLNIFAHNLYNKIDMVDDAETRYKHVNPEIPRRIGKIDDLDKFDSSFFGISYRQARVMDPQSRLLLEHAYESVIDSGTCPKSLKGSKTGVYIGASYNESEKKWIYEKFQKEGFGVVGSARTMLSNRISFALDLRGPSFPTDTACSSSMYALDFAYKMMSSGECDAALVGGTNLCLHPYVTLQFVKLGVVAPDGYCRPFDIDANGYTRAEVNCVMFLQKRRDAKRVYATLMHSKTNCDGFKEEGINFPSSKQQAQLLKDFYEEVKIAPNDPQISYFEAHCTGTKVGDAQECMAIDKVMCKNRKKPLLIGSVKSNMGHAEPGSGVCSISKVILAFENQKIPPTINLRQVKPEIKGIVEGRMKIIDNTHELPGCLIPLNSSGFGGANAHCLLRGNLKAKLNQGIPNDKIPRLVVWSGRTENAVDSVLESIIQKPLDAEYIALLQSSQAQSHTANFFKGFGVFTQEGKDQKAKCIKKELQHYDGIKRPMAWIYSGMGSQWCAMGKDLMKFPVFEETISKCHNILALKGVNLKEILTSEDESIFDNILHSFVGIAAIQLGLTNLLKSLQLEPDFIVGHSLGELGCAYADGCCDAEEMILSAYSRGMASLETKIIHGSMAAVGVGYNELKDFVPDGVEIACHNSFESTTISGPAENVSKFVAELKVKGIFAKEVASSNIPYHSSFIKNLGPNLLARLKTVHKFPKKRSDRWISSSYPKSKWHLKECQYTSAEYQTNNVLSPVLFEEALSHLPANVIAIEIAPHGLMQAILKRALVEASNLSLTQRGHKNNDHHLLNALGRIHSFGYDMDLTAIYPKVEYPVSRGTEMIAPHIKWDHSEEHFVMNFDDDDGGKSAERKVVVSLNEVEFEFIQGHCIDGRTIFPATGYIFLAWETLAMSKGLSTFDTNVEIEDIKFLRATSMTKEADVEFTIVIHPGTGKFEIAEGSSSLVTGIIKIVENPEVYDYASKKYEKCELLQNKDFYKELRLRGYHYNGFFRSVQEGSFDGNYGKIKFENWISFLDCLLQMKIIGRDTRNLILPTGIQKMVINARKHMTMIKSFKDEQAIVFDAIASTEMKSILCGGVEIVNLQASPVGRRKPLGIPVIESYQFIPHDGSVLLNTEEACRITAQLFLEVHQILKIKMLEVDGANGKNSILPFIGNAFGDIPLITCEMFYHSKREIENLENILISHDKLSTISNCGLVTISDPCKHEEVLNCLINRGFLIYRSSKNEITTVNNKLLHEMARFKAEDEIFIIYQYLSEDLQCEFNALKISEKDTNFGWIEKVKTLMKKQPLILYAENESLNGLIGMVNCLRKEPEGSSIQCVFIEDKSAPPFDLKDPFYKDQIRKSIGINVLRNGQWGSYRHLKKELALTEERAKKHCYVNALVKSDLSSLKWLEGSLNYSSNESEFVDVHYASLNFKDVMLATGKISADVFVESRFEQECILGFEYSGKTDNGQRVMGLIPSGALSSRIQPDHALMWNCPDNWNLSEAATVPCVYGTVYYAFFMTTHIEKGKSILIHAGTGGIGLAAIRVAFAYGLKVFTTVSTEEKKKFLLKEFPKLKAVNIGNSRDTSFEKMIMKRTNGKGVDYVLNSLAEEKLLASIRCLGHLGKFLEIGKFDMEKDTKIGMSCFLKELSFHSVMLDKLFSGPDTMKLKLAKLLDEDIKSGIIKPLKTNIFSASQVEQAFRLLASGRHMGKVLVQVRENENDSMTLPITVIPRVYCHSENSYVICGGLGGFGLELADWLIMRGCRKLVLSSSRGITKQYQAYRIKIWKSYGVMVVVDTSDITSRNGCEKLIRNSISLGPVGGIFNLAVVLRDGIFENQDEAKFKECMAPKAYATKYLDEISRIICKKLEYFVVFSSVACGRGNAGQANYGMANSVMEKVMEQRKKSGLPAKAIQWGAVGETGLLSDLLEDKIDMEIGGTLQQRISSCLEELDNLMLFDEPLVSSMVVAEKSYSSGKKGNVLDVILNIMGIRDAKSVSLELSLSELGMDSLMTVEIQQTLEREHNYMITAQDLRALTLRKLIDTIGLKEDGESQTKSSNIIDGSLLIRNLGDEKSANELLICFADDPKNEKLTLIIPGIEGVGGKIWEENGKNIAGSVFMIQHKNIKETSNLDAFTNELWESLKSLFSRFKKIHLIGFSFGSFIALKLSHRFEKNSVPHELTFIDGSPLFAKMLLHLLLANQPFEKTIEKMIFKTVAEAIVPNEKEKILHIIDSSETLVKKISLLVGETMGHKKYSEKYIESMIDTIMKRIRMIHEFDENDIEMLHNVSPRLIRPKNSALSDIDHEYGLQKYFKKKVEVCLVEGDHLSILESPEFKKLI